MRDTLEKNSPSLFPPWGEGVMSQGGRGDTTEKCVCMREYSVMCMSFSSVTVSQCHSVTERGCREEGVYSWSRDFCLL